MVCRDRPIGILEGTVMDASADISVFIDEVVLFACCIRAIVVTSFLDLKMAESEALSIPEGLRSRPRLVLYNYGGKVRDMEGFQGCDN